MATVIKLPAYINLQVEVDSPEGMVAALKYVAIPTRTPQAPRTEAKPQPIERYFRYISTSGESIVTLSQMRDRFARTGATLKPHLLEWAECAIIGERYDGAVNVTRISEADAKKQSA